MNRLIQASTYRKFPVFGRGYGISEKVSSGNTEAGTLCDTKVNYYRKQESLQPAINVRRQFRLPEERLVEWGNIY